MKNSKRIIFLIISVLLIALLPAISVNALQTDGAGNAMGIGEAEKDLDIEGDFFYLYDTSTSSTEEIKGKIGGDIFALGMDMQIEAEVGGSIRAATLKALNIENTSVRNITVASTAVNIGEGTKSKAIYAGAESFSFYGTCDYLEVYATEVYIYGKITNRAEIYADYVYFADTCDINKVSVEGMNTPKYFEKGNERNLKDYTENQNLSGKISFTQTYNQFQRYMASLLYTLPAAIILTLLLCLLLGKQLDDSGAMFKNTTGRHIGYGIIGAFLIPIAIFFLITLPYVSTAGVVLGIGYVLLALVASSFTAASLSRIILPNLNKYLSALIGITAVTMLTLLSAVSTAFTLFSLVYIFGYAINKLFIKKPELPPLDSMQM